MKRRLTATFLAIVMIVSVFAQSCVMASAANISSNKKKATNICGGQTIYVTTNTSIFANTVFGETDLTLYLKGYHANYYMKTCYNNKIKIETYKKSGNSWKKVSAKCGSFNVVHKDGYIVKIELPGRNVQYKVIITPVCTHNGISLKQCYENKGDYISGVKDVTGFTASLDYGTITKVA